jgi:2-succinyl-5-enolpyruvyl-6-hydroxy-3-cyclohexene-1-carboxylate synthase
LGAKVSQVLEETGLNVIRVPSDQQQYDQTTIFADSPESELGVACNQVISIVEDFIPHQGPVMADPQVAQQQRADVVIRLGQDI